MTIMAPQLNHSSSIIIVGAGTWGCSTALHLARRGYKNVIVLDPHPVPSPIAAGNDINKIMEHRELKGLHSQNTSYIQAANEARPQLRPNQRGIRNVYQSSIKRVENRSHLPALLPRDRRYCVWPYTRID